MKPRKWSADEKLAIVMEGLKEKRSVPDICRERQISQTLYYRWWDKFLEGGKKALVNGASEDNVYKAEIEKLQKIIGKQAIQIEILYTAACPLERTFMPPSKLFGSRVGGPTS